MDEFTKLEWYASGYDYGRAFGEMPTREEMDIDEFTEAERMLYIEGAHDGIMARRESQVLTGVPVY